MKKNWLIKNILIIVVAMAIFCLASVLLTNNIVRNSQEQSIRQFTVYAIDTLPENDFDNYFSNLQIDYRITIIDSDGVVLYDSEFSASEMENHSDREEIKYLNKFFVRKSETGNIDMLYFASQANNLIFRVAAPLNTINSYLPFYIGIIVLITVVLVALSVLYNYNTNKKIYLALEQIYSSLNSLQSGHFSEIIVDSDSEFNKVFNDLNAVQQIISENVEQLQLEKDKMQYIFENLEYGIIILDTEYSVTLINQKVIDLFNLQEDYLSKKIFSLNLDTEIIDLLGEVKAENGNLSKEVEVGSRVFVVGCNKIGENFILLFRDITETKRYQEMKSQFFENASHELKTPVTSIVGFCELMLASDEKSQKKYLQKIEFHSQRLLSLVNDMIELNKLDSKAMTRAEVVAVDVLEVVESVLKRLDFSTEKDKISVEVDGNGSVVAEIDEVSELCENLISNAIKYNKPNGNVNIKLKNLKDGVQIKVIDTGIGIASEDIPQLFERFYRVDKSRSKLTGGTGLGLSIVKHIVQKYDGEIKVTSKVGGGTTFDVTLKNFAK